MPRQLRQDDGMARRGCGLWSGPTKSGDTRHSTNSLNLIAAILTARSSVRVTPVRSIPKLVRSAHHSQVWGVKGGWATAGPAPVAPLVRSLRHSPACLPQSLRNCTLGTPAQVVRSFNRGRVSERFGASPGSALLRRTVSGDELRHCGGQAMRKMTNVEIDAKARSAGGSRRMAVLLRGRPTLTERLEDRERASPIWSDEPAYHHLDHTVT